jgi:bifunctional DNA-binding transcriptional regulator/antitoxin component of YhaV-PrlF toxin-antitoxin module
MTTSTLTAKNQTTIPKEVVKALGLGPSAQLVYEIEDGRVILTAKTATFESLAGSFSKKSPKRAFTAEEINAAAKNRAVARFRRTLS